MSTLIIGCGYLGRRVAARLVARGETVFGTCRSAAGAAELAKLGVKPIQADVLNVASLRTLPAADRVVYCVGYDRSAGADKRTVYVDGLRNALDRLLNAPARLVYVSSTSVYGGDDGAWIDEDSPAEPRTEAGRICLDAERMATAWGRAAKVEVVVLRCSGLYGPGRIVRRSMLERGEPIPGDPNKYLNLIHIDDAAQAVTAALDASAPSPLYLASDDRPVTRLEYYSLAAACLKAAPPQFVAPAPGSPEAARDAANRRASNRRMKAELGVELAYPDATSGVPAALGASEEGR
jgi:nucleoside-diphosphate-sugar epimerase